MRRRGNEADLRYVDLDRISAGIHRIKSDVVLDKSDLDRIPRGVHGIEFGYRESAAWGLAAL